MLITFTMVESILGISTKQFVRGQLKNSHELAFIGVIFIFIGPPQIIYVTQKTTPPPSTTLGTDLSYEELL